MLHLTKSRFLAGRHAFGAGLRQIPVEVFRFGRSLDRFLALFHLILSERRFEQELLGRVGGVDNHGSIHQLVVALAFGNDDFAACGQILGDLNNVHLGFVYIA